MEIHKLSIAELQKSISDKSLSEKEIFDHLSKRAIEVNKVTNALVTIEDSGQESSKDGPLKGIPIVIKDMFCTKGVKTTAASKILSEFIPPYNATVVEKCFASGGTLLAKANMDEFAMGSTNENSFYGSVKNAHDLRLVAGGSSGGSAVAVATGLSPISLGSDTGGSIRLPASFNGVFGFKPTYGRMSRFGMIAYGSSLDQAGGFSRNVEDMVTLTEVMSGFDPKDSTSFQDDNFNLQSFRTPTKMKVGVPKQLGSLGISTEIMNRYQQVIKAIEDQGHKIIEIDLESLDKSVSCYYIIAMSEASSNLSRFDGVRFGLRSDFSEMPPGSLEEFYSRTRAEGFGEEVKRRILLGTYSLSSGYYDEYYKKASLVRRKIQNEIFEAFSAVDLIVSPVNTQKPYALGEKTKDPIALYQTDLLTTFANLAGIPGMSCPISDCDQGPIGFQILANQKNELTIFKLAYELEQLGVFSSEVQDVL